MYNERTNPITRDGSGDPGELTITDDNGPPSVEADINCHFDPNGVGAGGPEVLVFMSRFSGSAADAAVATVNLRLYHPVTDQYYPLAEFEATGADGISGVQGNVLVLDSNPNCLGLHVEVTNLQANQDFHCVVDRSRRG